MKMFFFYILMKYISGQSIRMLPEGSLNVHVIKSTINSLSAESAESPSTEE